MTLSRRAVLKGAAGCSGLLCLGAAGCGNAVMAAPLVRTVVDPDGTVRIQTAALPDLEKVGGAISLELDLPQDTPFKKARQGLLVVHRAGPDDPPEFVASQLFCPHLACPLGYSAKDKLVECPCHASRFRPIADPTQVGAAAAAGAVVHPPAKQGLTMYPVVYDPLTRVLAIDLIQPLPTGPELPALVDGKITFALADQPALAEIGGYLVGHSAGLNDTLLVVRSAMDTVNALSAICTHQTCEVAFAAANNRIECPCHGSAFGLDGTVQSGPATVPIKQYAVTFDGTTVVIAVDGAP